MYPLTSRFDHTVCPQGENEIRYTALYSNKKMTSLHVNLMDRRVKRMIRTICEVSILLDDSVVLGFVCLLVWSEPVLRR